MVTQKYLQNLSREPIHFGTVSTREYCLMRQDDNGNVFLVARFRERSSAARACATYMAKNHKQMYWVTAADERNLRT